jgi:hypothetical protein
MLVRFIVTFPDEPTAERFNAAVVPSLATFVKRERMRATYVVWLKNRDGFRDAATKHGLAEPEELRA